MSLMFAKSFQGETVYTGIKLPIGFAKNENIIFDFFR